MKTNKGFIRRALAFVLCFVMLFGSAPLSGIASLDFSRFNISFPSFRLPGLFGTKAAADNTVAELVWDFDEETGTLTISGIGKMPSYSSSSRPEWYTYRNLIESIIISDSITSIGGCAFQDCTSLESIAIPNSITSIGGYAFSGCSKIQLLNIPDSVRSIGYYAFQNCSNLETVSLPGSSSGYTKIGNRTFYECRGLKRIIIPEQITEIGQYAFYCCTNLNYISIPKNTKKINSSSFGGCSKLYTVVYSGSLSEWCSIYFTEYDATPLRYAKSFIVNNKTLEEITQNDLSDITTIRSFAFFSYSNLKKVNLCNSIQVVGDYAFGSCSNLTDVTLPNSVTTIGQAAFSSCLSLLDITIPDSVTSIVSNAFGVAPTTVFYSGTATGSPWSAQNHYNYYEGDIAFSDSNKTKIAYCKKSAVSVKLSNNVVSIADEAFANCTQIDTLDIPNSVVTIGENAFYNVNNIRYSDNMTADGSPWGAKTVDAYIENGLYYFDESKVVLTGCDLSAADANGCVEVPDTVREVGDNCFAGASNVKSIEFGSEELIDFSTTSFADCKNLTTVSSPNTQDGITFMLDEPVGLLALTKSAQPTNAKSASQDEDVDITDMNGILFCNRSKNGTYNAPANIEYICENAFANCKNLTVNLDLCTLYSIGENAFLKCINYSSWEKKQTKLFEIGDYIISAKSDLSSLTVPGGCKCIADGAFKDCKALVMVTFEGEPYVGKDAFKDTPYMTNTSAWTGDAFYASHQLMEVRKTFSGVFTIPDGTTAIADGAFENCIGLTGVVVPASVRLIGSRAFENCANLTNVIFKSGSGLKRIGRYAFLNCLSLKNITIPAGVDDIGEFAFMNCDSLVAFVVNSGNRFYKASKGVLFRIGSKGNSLIQYPAGKAAVDTYTLDCARVESFAFRNCGNIYNINPASNNIILGYRNPLAKSSALYKYENYIVQDSRLVRWTAPQGEDNITLDMSGDENLRRIKEIGANAFEGETKLSGVVFNSNLTKIGRNAFEGCTGLTEVQFNENLERIEQHAFDGCTGLESITFEVTNNGDEYISNMQFIGDYAFTDTQVSETATDLIKAAGCAVEAYAFHQHIYEITGEQSATCTQVGGEIKTCTDSYCGKTVIVSATPALGHIFKDYTDNGNGTKTAVCCRDGCNETHTITVIEINMLKDAAIKVKNSINAARGSEVIVKATAVNVPSDFYLVIYEGSVFRAKGNNKSVSFSVDDIENNRTFTVKIVDRNGNPVSAENTQEEIKINIRQNFIERLIEFLINLFRLLHLFKV